MEVEILNLPKLPYVLTGKAGNVVVSRVHRQKCISNYKNEAFNVTSVNVCNITCSVTVVLLTENKKPNI